MYYIGIDLGGTNIAAGIVTEDGKILCSDSVPTINTRPIEEIMTDMADLCFALVKKQGISMDDIKAVGVGCPGSVDSKNGVIAYSNNIPMKNVKMQEFLENRLKKPVNLENDANAAAMGEYIVNGNGSDSFLFITLGTGVGGGVVLDKKIYRGFNGVGIEPGHMTTVSDGKLCSCGKKGCWEAYASITALISQTKEAMEKNPQSMMNEIAARDNKVSGRTAFEAAKAGDKTALEVVKKYQEYIADGLVSMINIFQPERVCIGGGISKEGEYLLAPVREFVDKYEFNKYCPKSKIEVATLFNDAGIIGAAMSAKE